MERANLILVIVVVFASLSVGVLVTAPWSPGAAAGAPADTSTPVRKPVAVVMASIVPTTSPEAAVSLASTPGPRVVERPMPPPSTATSQVDSGGRIQIIVSLPATVQPSATVDQPAPTSTVTPAGESPAAHGQTEGIVGNTGGDGVFVRADAVLAEQGAAWRDGTPLTLVGPETDADGEHWYNVRDPSGGVGWVPARYVILPTGAPPASGGAGPSGAPVARTTAPAPSSTSASAAQPTPTPTPVPPTATPTPSFDYVVASFRPIPVSGSRDIAYIRGRLVDRKGKLVAGTRFDIKSDSLPSPWTAIEPHGTTADGTVEFIVTRGSFAVRVDGGRSQDAGWMLTGSTGVPEMSDWEFVLQTTQ